MGGWKDRLFRQMREVGAPNLAIVGAGPAGLSAAIAARALGLSVVVIEREQVAGGIPRHCAHSPYGLREFGRLMTGPTYAKRLVKEAERAGANVRTGTSVVGIEEGPGLLLSSDEGVEMLRPKRVLLATGARETPRSTRLIGGTKPRGVMNTGTLQGLVHLNHRKPFTRPVILGTELVAFSALITLRQAGIRPIAMVEPAQRTTARWPSALLPAICGVDLRLGTDVTAIEGREHVEAVLVSTATQQEAIDADGLVVTGQFRPETAILQQSHLALDTHSRGPQVDQFGRCSDPTFFAAGNVLRAIETAGWCFREGRRIARAIASSLAGELPDPSEDLRLRAGEGVSYVVPQRLAPGERGGSIQLRASREVNGTLLVTKEGKTLAAKRKATRPERRILLPLSAIAPDAQGTAQVGFVER